MEVPEITDEKPYIEFRFDKKGEIKLSTTNCWWGGINGGFHSSNGYAGNTCKPKDLDRYVKAYKLRKRDFIKKEIEELINQLKNIR